MRTIAALIEENAGQERFGSPAWSLTFEDVRAVPTAKVPVVTFFACGQGADLKVDIVVNNRMGLL